MKSTVLAGWLAAALLGLAGLAHADEHGRGRGHGDGGRWGGEPRGWQQPGWQGEGGRHRGRGGWQQGQPAAPAPQPRYERQGPPVYVAPMPPQYRAQPQYAPPPQYGPPQYAAPQYAPPPPPRWNHARGFRPGDALPLEYRQRQFIVRDWRAHRLYAPPPGYMWVQPEPGSYLLIGGNGVIANMLVGQ